MIRSSLSWSSWPAVGHSAAAHMNRGVLPHCAGEDAHQAHPAEERVDRRADHFAEQRPRRVAAQRVRGNAAEVRCRRNAELGRRRKPAHQDLEQFRQAEP